MNVRYAGVAICLSLWTLTACDEADETNESIPDAARADAVTTPDAEPDPDASPDPDTAPDPDSAPLDAALPPDASPPDASPPDALPAPDATPIFTGLEFELASDAIEAGDMLSITGAMLDTLQRRRPIEITVVSDLEGALAIVDDAVAVTIAGRHVLTATAEFDGRTWQAVAVVEVSPAAAAALSLTLRRAATTAGVPVSFAITARDAFDNAVDVPADAITVEVATAESTLTDGELVVTTAGAHRVIARWGALEAAADLEVTAGQAVGLALQLTTDEASAGVGVPYSVSVADAWQNSIEPAIGDVITSSLPDGMLFGGGEARATAAGEYVVFARMGGLTGQARLRVHPGPAARMALTTAAVRAPAGTSVPLTLALHDGFDNPIDPATLPEGAVTWFSEPAGLMFGPDGVGGERVDTYEIVAAMGALSARAELTVDPGALADLTMVLGVDRVAAGVPVPMSFTGVDAFGNSVEVDTAGLELDSIPDGLELRPDEVVGETSGLYAVRARAVTGGPPIEARDSLVITPGSPVELVAALDPPPAEIEDAAAVAVALADAFGNATDAPWSVRIEDEEGRIAMGASVEGAVLSFVDDGRYFVVVETSDGALSTRLGPVIIDRAAPQLEIWTPDFGGWTVGDEVVVAGRADDGLSGIDRILVGFRFASISEDGTWVAVVPVNEGINEIDITAFDLRGNTRVDSVVVLAGQFLARDRKVLGAAQLALDSGSLQDVGDLLEDLVDAETLDDLIGELLRSGTCDGDGCVPAEELIVDLENVTLGEATSRLSTSADGKLIADLDIIVASLDTRVRYAQNGAELYNGVHSTDGRITVQVAVDIQMNDGGIGAELVSAETTDSEWTPFPIPPFADAVVISQTGKSANNLIFDLTDAVVTNRVATDVPDALGGVFDDMQPDDGFEMFGNTYSVDASIANVIINADGIVLEYDAAVGVDEWRTDTALPGSPHVGQALPEAVLDQGLTVDVSMDMINNIMFTLWGGGAFQQEATLAELGIDPMELDLPEDADQYTVTAAPALPPLLSAGNLGIADVQMGAYDIALSAGEGVGTQTLLAGNAMFEGGTSMSVIESNIASDVVLGGAVANVDAGEEGDFAHLMDGLTSRLEGDVADAIGVLPLPASRVLPLEGNTAQRPLDGNRTIRLTNLNQ